MKARILVIDDEESIRFTFSTFLSEQGHEVLVAEDYDSAMEIISREYIDLIFADIILGGQTGIDVLRQVRKKNMQCPVIIITGQPDIESAAESVRLGASDYLIKPVRKQHILPATAKALELRALAHEKELAEAEKERYRNNLDAIFRSLSDAVITVDNEMRVTEANKAVEDICRTAPRDIIGRMFREIRNQCLCLCQKVLMGTLEKQRTVRNFRIECRYPGKPRQILIVNGSPLKNSSNESIGAVLIIRDITRLTNMETELKERHGFHNIIGKNKEMQEIFKLVEMLADSPATVLITGESGTGKELIARAIHYGSSRSHNPLVTVNCAALPENLLESELFGHARGAFTGAIKDKPGSFQVADGGTIFLDEIGDISRAMQAKLMRVLQYKEFNRVGDPDPVRVNVRIVAATNQSLDAEIKAGRFREDLYYRLKVVEIVIPPLRERPEDILLLADHFTDLYNRTYNKDIKGMSDEVRSCFMHYKWPGNIRELEHAIEHAFVHSPGNVITPDHIPPVIWKHYEQEFPDGRFDEAKKIMQVLKRTGWNKARAARILGISRPTLYSKIEKYGIISG